MEKKLLVFIKEGLEGSQRLQTVLDVLAGEGAVQVIVNNRQTSLDTDGVSLAISLGGDGNLITLARLCAGKNIPIIGINGGTLGFLTEISPADFGRFYAAYKAGKLRCDRPFMLLARINLTSGQSILRYAFNDVVLTREDRFLLANISAHHNGRCFNSYHSDGLIVSSPSGSTAYNMSAGGPLIYPLSRVFCILPICSHSLSQRPLVLPKGFEIELKSSNCSLAIDGHESFAASEFSSVCVGLSKVRAQLLRWKDRSHFAVLKEKLGWGENE